jgi:hypothetical protein
VKLFGRKNDVDETIPAPGTPPTFDEHGVLTDPGNPWFGPINQKLGYATEGFSGEQRRRIRRASERRSAAEVRVASRNYARNQEKRARYESFVAQRTRIVTGEIAVEPYLLASVQRDEARRRSVTRAFETQAETKQAKADRIEDRLDARRIARFKAGKPRGKDLREETFKQYSSFLPASYWQTEADYYKRG